MRHQLNMEKEEGNSKENKEEHTIRIGPLLKKVLEKQMRAVREATYEVCESSYWEAGEIIAKKVADKV